MHTCPQESHQRAVWSLSADIGPILGFTACPTPSLQIIITMSHCPPGGYCQWSPPVPLLMFFDGCAQHPSKHLFLSESLAPHLILLLALHWLLALFSSDHHLVQTHQMTSELQPRCNGSHSLRATHAQRSDCPCQVCV